MTPTPADPLCFVAMPFGAKRDANGTQVDFDAIYAGVIRPAVEAAGLTCIRGDEEPVGGLIHKGMFQRLLLCDFAVADLSTANANVFYELGIRHAFRPFSTVLIYADGFRLPFDVAPLRALKYHLDPAGRVTQPEADARSLTRRLVEARDHQVDSPLFQVFDRLQPSDLQHLVGEDLADSIRDSARLRDAAATATTMEQADAVRDELAGAVESHPGVVAQLLGTYQALGGYSAMVSLIEGLPADERGEVFVRERYALALNRLGRRVEARRVLTTLLQERGPSSETFGLLGRVHKDEWEEAVRDGALVRGSGALRNAIEAYREGFVTDPRDPYPGVNAVELMAVRDRHDGEWRRLLPVVRFIAERRVDAGGATYWEYATLLELAVMGEDADGVLDYLGRALAAGPGWAEALSTLDSVNRLAEALYDEPRPAWLVTAVAELRRAAAHPATPT
ncbi:MAG: TRAFs-binding domain-containing protein [Actinomycetales bacterium]